MLKFSKEITGTIITSNFYLKFKENNDNDMAAHLFWAVFIRADGKAKSAKQLISTVLPFHQLHFPWFCTNLQHNQTKYFQNIDLYSNGVCTLL